MRLMKTAPALLACAMAATVAYTASAQSVVDDMLAGKLVKPKVGQWAWYDIVDTRTNSKYVIRQAIVGKEKVNRKMGYWVELEVIPAVGFTHVFKLLLTGPASDPANIQRVIRRQGPNPPQEVPVTPPPPDDEGDKEAEKEEQEKLDKEEVETLSGTIRARHYRVTRDERVIDLWLSDDVLPSGIVRMQSEGAVMTLRSHGTGGKFAESVINRTAEPDSKTRVEASGTAGKE